jgi:hypothetical protein
MRKKLIRLVRPLGWEPCKHGLNPEWCDMCKQGHCH